MIQDIAPHRFDNAYRPECRIRDDDAVLFFHENTLLFEKAADGELSLLTYRAVRSEIEEKDLLFLFSVDETAFFLLRGKELSETSGRSAVAVSALRLKKPFPQHLIFALLTAHHLQRWYEENRYCGTCAQETAPDSRERALNCVACGRKIYPKIMPAVIVAVTNGDEIVLTRYANRPITYHALVAGFNEIGETLEDTVRREVMEEVGLKVKNIRYYKSQPWAVAGDILAGFFCDVDGDTTIRMDDAELKEAVWIKREDVDGQPDNFSLTNEMMMAFKENRFP